MSTQIRFRRLLDKHYYILSGGPGPGPELSSARHIHVRLEEPMKIIIFYRPLVGSAPLSFGVLWDKLLSCRTYF